ncbi:MAG: transcription termination/antitermination NusG family protein [Pseudomonadota bacterium]
MDTKTNPIEGMLGYPWYAVRVAPGQERAVADALAANGVPAIAPVYYRWVLKNRHTYKKRLRIFPLVPGYIFAGVEDWGAVNGVRGVLGAVGIDGEPIRIPYMELADFLTAHHEADLRPRPGIPLKRGDDVEVREHMLTGQWDSISGKIDRVHGKRAKVLANFFGSQILMDVLVDDLVKVAPGARSG